MKPKTPDLFKFWKCLRCLQAGSAKAIASLAILLSFVLVACDGGGGGGSAGGGFGVVVFGTGSGGTPTGPFVPIRKNSADSMITNMAAVTQIANGLTTQPAPPSTANRALQVQSASLVTQPSGLQLTINNQPQSAGAGAVSMYNITLVLYSKPQPPQPSPAIGTRQFVGNTAIPAGYVPEQIFTYQVDAGMPGQTLQITLARLNADSAYVVAIQAIYVDGTSSESFLITDTPRDLGPDPDRDGYSDSQDNCPMVANEDQADTDNDYVSGQDTDKTGGDACDTDSDGDGVTDAFVDSDGNFGVRRPDGNVNFELDIDRDGDGLIEIYDAETLDWVRYSLAGTNRSNDAGFGLGKGEGCGFDGNSTCNGYELTMDIDLSAYNNGVWNPIGNTTSRCSGGMNAVCADFTAIFDGNNHTINFRSPDGSAASHIDATTFGAGLFAGLGSGAVVRNLRLADVRIPSAGISQVGALAGGATGARIENVIVNGASIITTGADQVGGLIGWADGVEIISSAVTARSFEGEDFAIAGVDSVGGLVGYVSGTGATSIESSWVLADAINATAGNLGGLVGKAENSPLEVTLSSVVVSTIAVTGNGVGGLIGEITGSSSTIRSSYVIANSIESSAVGNIGNNLGGLIGYADVGATISGSFVSINKILGSPGSNGIGGLIGSSQGATDIDASIVAVNNITGNNNIGGLVGDVGSSAPTIDSSLVLGAHFAAPGLVSPFFEGDDTASTISNSHWQSDLRIRGAQPTSDNNERSRAFLQTKATADATERFTGWELAACNTLDGTFNENAPDPIGINQVRPWLLDDGHNDDYPALNCFGAAFAPAQQRVAIFSGLNGDNDGDKVDALEPTSPFALLDNCPHIANRAQRDADGDAQGNLCDRTLSGEHGQVTLPTGTNQNSRPWLVLRKRGGVDTNVVILTWAVPANFPEGYELTGGRIDYRRFDSTNTDNVVDSSLSESLDLAEVRAGTARFGLFSVTPYDFNLTLEFTYQDPDRRAASFGVEGALVHFGKITTGAPAVEDSVVQNLRATPEIGGATLSWTNPQNPDANLWRLSSITIEGHKTADGIGARTTLETITAPAMLTPTTDPNNPVTVSDTILGLDSVEYTFYVNVHFTRISDATITGSSEDASDRATPVSDNDQDGFSSALPQNHAKWDNCPGIYNPNQQDSDNDEAHPQVAGIGGDACDNILGTVGQASGLAANVRTPTATDDDGQVTLTWTNPTIGSGQSDDLPAEYALVEGTIRYEEVDSFRNTVSGSSREITLNPAALQTQSRVIDGLKLNSDYRFSLELAYTYDRTSLSPPNGPTQLSPLPVSSAPVNFGNPANFGLVNTEQPTGFNQFGSYAVTNIAFSSTQLKGGTLSWDAPAGPIPATRNVGAGPVRYTISFTYHGDDDTASIPAVPDPVTGSASNRSLAAVTAPATTYTFNPDTLPADDLTTSGNYVFFVTAQYEDVNDRSLYFSSVVSSSARLPVDSDGDGFKDPGQPANVRNEDGSTVDDNCNNDANPSQTNLDNDGAGDACDDTLDHARTVGSDDYLTPVTDESIMHVGWNNPTSTPPNFAISGGTIGWQQTQLDASKDIVTDLGGNPVLLAGGDTGTYTLTAEDLRNRNASLNNLIGLSGYSFNLTLHYTYTEPRTRVQYSQIGGKPIIGRTFDLGAEKTNQAPVAGRLVGNLDVVPGIKSALLTWTAAINPDIAAWEIRSTNIYAQKIAPGPVGPLMNLVNLTDTGNTTASTLTTPHPSAYQVTGLAEDGTYRFSIRTLFAGIGANTQLIEARAATAEVLLYTDPDGDALTADSRVPNTNALWDNCPNAYNPNQADIDSDELTEGGDACDDTIDGGMGKPTITTAAHLQAPSVSADFARIALRWDDNPALSASFVLSGGRLTTIELDADNNTVDTTTRDLASLEISNAFISVVEILNTNLTFALQPVYTYTGQTPPGGGAAPTQVTTGELSDAVILLSNPPLFIGDSGFAPSGVGFTKSRVGEATVTWTAPSNTLAASRRVGDRPSKYRVEAEYFGNGGGVGAAQADPAGGTTARRTLMEVDGASTTRAFNTQLTSNGWYKFHVTSIYEDHSGATYDSDTDSMANAERLGVDTDGDGVKDVGQPATLENSVASNQANTVFDNCLNDANPTQSDADNDNTGDACDDTLGGVPGSPQPGSANRYLRPGISDITVDWTNPTLESGFSVTGAILGWTELDQNGVAVSGGDSGTRTATSGLGGSGGVGQASIPNLKGSTSYSINLTLQFTYTDSPNGISQQSDGDLEDIGVTRTLAPSVSNAAVNPFRASPRIESAVLTWVNPVNPQRADGAFLGLEIAGIYINTTVYGSLDPNAPGTDLGEIDYLTAPNLLGHDGSDLTHTLTTADVSRFMYALHPVTKIYISDDQFYDFTIVVNYTDSSSKKETHLSAASTTGRIQLLEDADGDDVSADSQIISLGLGLDIDNCPTVANTLQEDTDTDHDAATGVGEGGDACDTSLNGTHGQPGTGSFTVTPQTPSDGTVANAEVEVTWDDPTIGLDSRFSVSGGTITWTELDASNAPVGSAMSRSLTTTATTGEIATRTATIGGLDFNTKYDITLQFDFDYQIAAGNVLNNIAGEQTAATRTTSARAILTSNAALAPAVSPATTDRLKAASVTWTAPTAPAASRNVGSLSHYEVEVARFADGSITAPVANTRTDVNTNVPASGTLSAATTTLDMNNAFYRFYVTAVYSDGTNEYKTDAGLSAAVRTRQDTDNDGVQDPGQTGISNLQSVITANANVDANTVDNCPGISIHASVTRQSFNPSQSDYDMDGIGDPCDSSVVGTYGQLTGLTASNPTTNSVDLSWTNPPLPQGFTLFSVPVSWSGGSTTLRESVLANQSITITGLAPNTSYSFSFSNAVFTYRRPADSSLQTSFGSLASGSTNTITTLSLNIDFTDSRYQAQNLGTILGVTNTTFTWTQPTVPSGYNIDNITVKAESYGGDGASRTEANDTEDFLSGLTTATAPTSHFFGGLINGDHYKFSVRVGQSHSGTGDAGEGNFAETAIMQLLDDIDGDNIPYDTRTPGRPEYIADNCPFISNSAQRDSDGDGATEGGNACDDVLNGNSYRPGNLAASNPLGTSINLTWDNPNFTNLPTGFSLIGANVTYREVASGVAVAGTGGIVTMNAATARSESYALSGLSPVTRYEFEIIMLYSFTNPFGVLTNRLASEKNSNTNPQAETLQRGIVAAVSNGVTMQTASGNNGTDATITWNNPTLPSSDVVIASIVINATRYTDSGGGTAITGSTATVARLVSGFTGSGATGLSYQLTGLAEMSHYRFHIYVQYRDPSMGDTAFSGPAETGVVSTGVAPAPVGFDPTADDDSDGVLNGVDVDYDGDGLIEVSSAAHLSAIRHQLDGTGRKLSASGNKNINGCPSSGSGRQAKDAAGNNILDALGNPITACYGYELNQTIDISHIPNWEPIGHCTNRRDGNKGISRYNCFIATAFSGVFDGNNHNISGMNLNINHVDFLVQSQGNGGWGLFGLIIGATTDKLGDYGTAGDLLRPTLIGAAVRNLRLTDVEVTSTPVTFTPQFSIIHAGAVVGRAFDADITNVHAEIESFAAADVDHVGGLVGWFQGRVDHNGVAAEGLNAIRHSSTRIKSLSGETAVGGLVGTHYSGDIISSSVVANTISGQRIVGGLVGHFRNLGRRPSHIRASTAIVKDIQGRFGHAGGLVGYLERRVKGASGGAISRIMITDSSAIANSVTTEAVTGRRHVGGLVGVSARGGTDAADSFDIDRSMAVVNIVAITQGLTDVDRLGGIVGILARKVGQKVINSFLTLTDAYGTYGSEPDVAPPLKSDVVDTYFNVRQFVPMSQQSGSLPLMPLARPTDNSYILRTTSPVTGAATFGQTLSALMSPTSNTGIYANWYTAFCSAEDGSYASSSQAGYINVWNLGNAVQYPALACTPLSTAEQRAAIANVLGNNDPVR